MPNASGKSPNVPSFVSAASPRTTPTATHSVHCTGKYPAARLVTMRIINSSASDASGTARLSLLTAPLMNRNIGRKALNAAASRATSGRPGATSVAMR